MKRALISVSCAIFISGTACAREIEQSPTFLLHGSSVIAAHRTAQLNSVTSVDGVLCMTEYIPTRDRSGWYVRKSVDCEE
jgi:hypothetical protein